ncbi:PssE/Cps14G family polysaccharide biosynthesis glycosyltransferase [Faecalibacterium sp. An192]|uniref:PssE/Cps14G family polysaccharide biosynthesis glycosyltransferase n=1 Tax=Faecalibacterium sp. An192 TaxID=1965581 RepID=UPI000B3700C6|nr:PssE/Cps14G family polysaccharide biosynthesis glycosyltransferase [Faecalibacterium sp. An192]OUP26451.1 beta(1,3)galactosyltransferase EpsH [Faecalibacterium sp. An192]
MIFVTLGSQKFQFDRLLQAVDELQTDEEIFAQIGYSEYKPKHFKYKRFLDRDEFDKIMDSSNIVITHGGTGAIIGAVKKGKKVIAVPRLKKYGEHVDDHQIQLVNQFSELNLIYPCIDCDIQKALDTVKRTTYASYKSNTARIIRSLEEFINE